MSDDTPDFPFGFDPEDFSGQLPEQFQQMFEQLGPALQNLQSMFAGGIGGADSGPVNWDVATKMALQIAAADDRDPTPEEEARAQRAWEVAEHWLDAGELPNPTTSGRLVVAGRAEWAQLALRSIRPMIEPIADANVRAMTELAAEQFSADDVAAQLREMGMEGMEAMLGNFDPSQMGQMMRPMAAHMSGVQAGQVVGQLATQLLGQYDLGIPTAPSSDCFHLAHNVTDTFAGYDLDATEIDVVLALNEGAYRRLYAAIPWLEGHIHRLVAQFAQGTKVDAEALAQMAQELMEDVDLEDPASLERAQRRAAEFRFQPTPEQQRVLERLQGVTALVGAWARAEARRAAGDRIPSLGRIEEVLKRRRATQGDGEQALAQLLGLDLRPDDETIGEAFVAYVEETAGPQALRAALAHPENLPTSDELAEPARWLARTTDAPLPEGMEVAEETEDEFAIPDDVSELFSGLGDAPVELSAEERVQAREADDGSDA